MESIVACKHIMRLRTKLVGRDGRTRNDKIESGERN